jgi:hypothetical protein
MRCGVQAAREVIEFVAGTSICFVGIMKYPWLAAIAILLSPDDRISAAKAQYAQRLPPTDCLPPFMERT